MVVDVVATTTSVDLGLDSFAFEGKRQMGKINIFILTNEFEDEPSLS